jgi:hypothetical protein
MLEDNIGDETVLEEKDIGLCGQGRADILFLIGTTKANNVQVMKMRGIFHIKF